MVAQKFPCVFNGCQLVRLAPRNQNATSMAAEPNDNDTLAKALERTRGQVQRRMLHKEVLHDLIRRFVAAYMREAKLDDPGLSKEEREDLIRGKQLKIDLKEKWAIRRAEDHFGRDERTIREAINRSKRSRPKR
jgi:hypothetical protein